MLKKILVGIVICLTIIVIAFIWYFNNQSIKVTVVKEAYNMLVSEGDKKHLEVNLLVNQKDTYITNGDKIASCYIHCYDNSESYQMNIKDISLVNQTSINKDNYYVYKYTLEFRVSVSSDIIMNEAYLVLNYNNSKSLDIMIGSISVYAQKENGEELSLSCMKAVTRRIDNTLTIEGIVLRLSSKKYVQIVGIECLDCNIITQGGVGCNYEDINSSDDLDDSFNSSYDYLNINTASLDYDFNGRGELAIRIGYLNHYEINSFPIRIYYVTDDVRRTLDIDTFTFFVNNERKVKISDLTIYEFEYN